MDMGIAGREDVQYVAQVQAHLFSYYLPLRLAALPAEFVMAVRRLMSAGAPMMRRRTGS